MRITPLDIYQQEFKRVLRGIDPDEVEDFLERVADDYEQALKENAALKEQIESLKVQLDMGGEIGKADDSDKAAREDAGNIIREAKKEADNLIREARKEADNIVRKAEASAVEAHKNIIEAEKIPDVGSPTTRKNKEAETNDLAGKVKIDEPQLRQEISKLGKVKMEELQLRQEISRLCGQKERFLIEYRELLEKHLKILTENV